MNAVPTCWLLDAQGPGWTEQELRSRARALNPHGAAHVSRSYRFPFALVAAHHTSTGVDIERVDELSESFARVACSHDELAELDRLISEPGALSSLWSSKEALSKALGDPIAYDPRLLPGPAMWGGLGSTGWSAAPVEVPANHVAWLVWRDLSPAGTLGPLAPIPWSPGD